MSETAITPFNITAGYVEFDLCEGAGRKSVVVRQDVIEEHALRHPMSAPEIRKYVAANFDTFAAAVRRAGPFTRRADDVIVIDRMEQLDPRHMRRCG